MAETRQEQGRPAIRWERLPLARELPPAREWLAREAAAGLSAVTIDAYSRAVERYLAHCRERRLAPAGATTAHLAAYFEELAVTGLGRAARLQRLAALRLFYAFVVEVGMRPDNPAAGLAGLPLLAVAADEEAPGQPWAPTEGEWLAVLGAAAGERPRSRLMLALAYEGALRREDLCGLRRADADIDRRLLRLPAAGGRTRLAPLSRATAARLAAYLAERDAGERRGPAALFRSESPRNRAAPISIWTWSKVTRGIARRSGTARFTGRTPRCLRLVDLARAGRDAAAIARFAGAGRPAAALPYLRLARELPGPAAAVEPLRAAQLEWLLVGAGD